MALIHATAAGSALAFAIGCSAAAAVQPPGPSASVSHATAQGTSKAVVGGPSSSPCSLGQMSDAVPRVEMDALLANPEPYYGRQVVLRGYFILENVETTALLEPKRRQNHILVGVKRLPLETPEQLLACRLKIVDIEGYITHIPTRRGEAPILLGEAMIGASKQ